MTNELEQTANELLRTNEELAAKKQADNRIISSNINFQHNNWIRPGVENDTIQAIAARSGAMWLTPSGEIAFRALPNDSITYLEKAKAQTRLANYLDRPNCRLLTGTKEVDPDIFPNDLLCVTEKFTPFAESEFYQLNGTTFRTSWRPTEYMQAATSTLIPKNIHILLKRLTNHDQMYLNWVLNWIAGFFQKRRRSQCALVLKGDQGSGKGILVEHILAPLFGQEFCVVVDDDRLSSSFKNWIDAKMFYILNEISHDKQGRKALKNFIKQLVTDLRVQAEQKYKDAGAIEVFGQVLITSNELAPLEIETSDRRFTVMQTDKALKKDGIDTTKLIQDIQLELMDFASFLIGYDVDWEIFDTALDTPEKSAIVNATTDKTTLLGNALKSLDKQFFEPIEDTNHNLYRTLCEDLAKGRVQQKLLADIYEALFDDEISGKAIVSKLRTFDILIFGKENIMKSNGYKYYLLKKIENTGLSLE